MSKINFTLDITDEMFDEAAQQLIKSKVRQAIANEMSATLEPELNKMVDRYVKTAVENLNDKWAWSKESRKVLNEKIYDKIAELNVSEKSIQVAIDSILQPVSEYAEQKKAEIDSIISEKLNSLQESYTASIAQSAGNVAKVFIEGLIYDKEDSDGN